VEAKEKKQMKATTPLIFYKILTCIVILFLSQFCPGQILHVGSGYPFQTLNQATDMAIPGDTILVHEGIYNGGIYVEDLQGTPDQWIYILASGEVIFNGGNNAWQFTDAAYLHISGFIFEHQVGNGLNFDDGGTYETPAHHVIFDHCIFRDMNASGNNDLLKLSGLDSFTVHACTFLNGADGGSGIDMVGCHDGNIDHNHFENLGSNSIQCKGGSRNIRIEANFFKNGGSRALNLGGSTGLQFFRPIDAPFESAELKVYSNIIIGSEAPVAFVGTINTEVVNNTIYLPEKWVLRILQETVDESRFAPCGYNTFRNNIVYLDDRVNIEVNIGPNTAPETFTFSNNLWYQSNDINWNGPDLPVEDFNAILNQSPLFVDAENEDFSLQKDSPAIGNGFGVEHPEFDFADQPFLFPRSIGAFEGGATTHTNYMDSNIDFNVYPNPFKDEIILKINDHPTGPFSIRLLSLEGREVFLIDCELTKQEARTIAMPGWVSGCYILIITSETRGQTQTLLFRS
jgi:hypothetical protein